MAALHQMGCVSIGGRGVLIEGPTGSGKTSLALMLIDRGAALVGDDGVSLELRGHILWASPAPKTAGLIELRNVGIISLPAVEAPIALHLSITRDAPRYIEQSDVLELAGCPIPSIRLDADGAAAAIRAEYALGQYGLSPSAGHDSA